MIDGNTAVAAMLHKKATPPLVYQPLSLYCREQAGPVPDSPLNISISLQASSHGGGAAQPPKLNKTITIVAPPSPFALLVQRI